MSYIYFNPNPENKNVGDCVVRALCVVLNCDWETAFTRLTLEGFLLHDMPSSDSVWGSLLQRSGFVREVIPNSCPYCYTAKDFCMDNPKGLYVLGTGSHAIGIVDGNYYDAWDSGDKPIIFYWREC
jgi:hypothetical protein